MKYYYFVYLQEPIQTLEMWQLNVDVGINVCCLLINDWFAADFVDSNYVVFLHDIAIIMMTP